MQEIAPGIRRATQQLPLGIDHVHVYFVRLDGGGWMLVDTGLGLPGAQEWWRETLAQLDAPLERIVVTHFHPDHVGGSGIVAALTGAPVSEGALDREQSVRVWTGEDWLDRLDAWFASHGTPEEARVGARAEAEGVRRFVRLAPEVEPLEPGDVVEGWQTVPFPGHADGQLGLLRDGVLLAADHLLPRITPIVGLYPGSRPDPLADFTASLERVLELAPRLVLPGHGEPVEDPARRARELIAHHVERLSAAEALLNGTPVSGYEASRALWSAELGPTLRRMATAEALAHLERLVAEGRARRADDGRSVAYTGAT